MTRRAPFAPPAETEVEALATTSELAEFLRVDDRTLKRWRRGGRGPQWIAIEGSVRYRWADVERWLADNSSETSGGTR